MYPLRVGRNTDCDQEVVAVYFYSPWVVLFVCQCLSVGPEAVVNAYSSACLGCVTSSFFGFRVNLVNEFAGFAHLSPAGCMLLALTVPAMNSSFLAVEFCVIVPSTSEAHRGFTCVVGYLVSHACCVSKFGFDSITTIQEQIWQIGSLGSLSMCIWGGPRL